MANQSVRGVQKNRCRLQTGTSVRRNNAPVSLLMVS